MKASNYTVYVSNNRLLETDGGRRKAKKTGRMVERVKEKGKSIEVDVEQKRNRREG